MSCLERASAPSTKPPKCQILSWALRAPNILAIDLGTQTGWAIVSGFGSIRSGSRSFKLARDEAPGLAFWRFARWLTEIEEQVQGFDAVYYEAVFAHKGTIAAHKYGAFEGQLLSWCAGRDIPVQGVAVSTIKKHATGFGYAGKQAVIDAMCALGFERKKIREGSDPFWAFVPTSSVQITGKEPRWEQDSHRKSSLVPTVPTYC